LAVACALAGCGTPGAPLAPSLNLPEPVTDLAAVRAGGTVTLTWTMPKRNTDKTILKGDVLVRVCRSEAKVVPAGGCADAGLPVMEKPAAAATFTDTLPAAESSGDPRALRYFVELKNARGRSAGLSNAATVLAGTPPGAVTGLAAEVRKSGVVLTWTKDGEQTPVRLLRTLLTPAVAKPKASKGLLGAPEERVDQTLLIEDAGEGRALDKTARFGETYAYRAQRVAQVTVDGATLELPGAVSEPVTVDVEDVFPPAVPSGLVAVATVGAGETAIDLSWQPDAEADVAGYAVYRREGDGAWMRVSGAAPVVGPAFHDTNVQAGHQYTYAVTAIDAKGHESARSAEASETVPNH
jgi:hypothetical protein